MSTTTPKTLTITRRSRNLGIGWTSQPVQVRAANGSTHLAIADVTEPSVVGTLREVAEERDRARRVNSGHDWHAAFFVGGVRVERERFLIAMELLLARRERERGERGALGYMSDAETVEVVA